MNYNILCKDTVRLRIFAKDLPDHSAKYDEFLLRNVRVTEKASSDPDMTKDNGVTVYFFPTFGKCTDENGDDAPLPRLGYGDLCVIHPSDDGEKQLRVHSVEYHRGVSDGKDALSHVKIILR